MPGRLLYAYVHEALIELHKRSGRFTRLGDGRSALEFTKGAAYLAARIVVAVESGWLRLLVGPR